MPTFVYWILLGLVAGALAKLIMPGKDPGGIFVTILLGIAGSFVGGKLGSLLQLGKTGDGASFDLASIATAVIGAIILLFGWRMITKKK